ncbi:MAG: hypothetical protein QW667_08035 [Candidatus Bathyarchaeia archaeon]
MKRAVLPCGICMVTIFIISMFSSAFASEDVSTWDVWKYAYHEIQQIERDIYPGTSHFYIPLIIVPRDGKDWVIYYFKGNVKQMGEFTLTFTMSYGNPHNKWHHIIGYIYFVLTDPTDLPAGGDVLPCAPWPSAILVPRGYALIDCQNITISFTAVKTGTVYCYFESHCVITDVNGDGVVNILDISAIAIRYGQRVHWEHPNYIYDVDCDTWIDMNDLIFTSSEFGRQIPP